MLPPENPKCHANYINAQTIVHIALCSLLFEYVVKPEIFETLPISKILCAVHTFAAVDSSAYPLF